MRRKLCALIVATALSSLLFSCGQSSPGGTDPADTDSPTVVSTSISDGATDISLIERIEFTFSEDMDPTTIGDATFFVAGRAPRGFVEYDAASRTASIVPDTLYNADTWHIATVTSGATDTDGNPAVPETISFQTGPLDRDHVVDWLEPNESPAEAAVVDTGVVYHTLSGSDPDDDFFAFTLTESKKVTIKTPIIYAPIGPRWPGWNIHFTREDGEWYGTMGTSAHTGDIITFSRSFLPGTYYGHVFNSYGLEAADFILYDLKLETGPPCQDDAYEDNDFLDALAPISPGFHTDLCGCEGDYDYYSIAMEAGQTLTVTLDATFNQGGWENRRVKLVDPDGNPVSYEGLDNPCSLDVTAATSGNARYEVLFWVDGVSYTLDIDLTD